MSAAVASWPRGRFVAYVRDPRGKRPVVFPFLPDPDVVRASLPLCGLEAGEDTVKSEISLARELNDVPMSMTGR